jgi:hypothetical protein
VKLSYYFKRVQTKRAYLYYSHAPAGGSQNIDACEAIIDIDVGGGYSKSACYNSAKRNQAEMKAFCSENSMTPLILNEANANSNFYASLSAIKKKMVAFVDGVKLGNGIWIANIGIKLNSSLITDDGKTKSKCNTITLKPGKAPQYFSNADDCSKTYGSFCEFVNMSLTSKWMIIIK